MNAKQKQKAKRPTFAAWVKNLTTVGRMHGYSDREIRQWVKIYAAKRRMPRSSVINRLNENALWARGPYKRLDPASRAAMGRQIQQSPKLRLLMTEFDKELKRWQVAVIKTVQSAKDQSDDVNETRKAIIEPLQRGWNENIFRHYMSFDEFIKRLVPELQLSQ